MGKPITIPTPERFWHIYAKQLNKIVTRDEYDSSAEWTPLVTKAAEETCEEFGLECSREYFRVDLTGFITNREAATPGKKQYDWQLVVAYEHENEDDWDGELCKLCHVVAELRALSSYYDFTSDKPIEVVLAEKIATLGWWRINRVPACSWLFVFGPRRGSYDKPFRAFTLDSRMNLIDISEKAEAVIPRKSKEAGNAI